MILELAAAFVVAGMLGWLLMRACDAYAEARAARIRAERRASWRAAWEGALKLMPPEERQRALARAALEYLNTDGEHGWPEDPEIRAAVEKVWKEHGQ